MVIDPTTGLSSSEPLKPTDEPSRSEHGKRPAAKRGEGEAAGLRSHGTDPITTREIAPEVIELRGKITKQAETASRLQTAEHALENIHEGLVKAKSLASAGTDNDLDKDARAKLNIDFIDARIEIAHSNKQAVFDGGNALQAALPGEDFTAGGLGIEAVDLSSADDSIRALGALDAALERIGGSGRNVSATLRQVEEKSQALIADLNAALEAGGNKPLSADQLSETLAESEQQIAEEMELARLSQSQQKPQNLLKFFT